MSSITFDTTTAGRIETLPVTPVLKRQGLFARVMAARQRQAMLELSRHGLRLPRELEEAGLKIGSRNEDSLPFVR